MLSNTRTLDYRYAFGGCYAFKISPAKLRSKRTFFVINYVILLSKSL